MKMVNNMKSSIDLSIIIPVYNGEEYLKRCLESIVPQLNDKTELIIVDDGSTDKSKSVYTKFTEKYNNAFAYFKSNGGVSSARNLGIEKARGKYLTFVDADDFVSNNFIERLLSETKDDIDVLFFQYNSDDIMNNTFNVSKTITKEITNDDIIKDTFLAKSPIKNCKYNFRAVWSKVIKRKVIEDNKILFPENISFGEDMIFMLYVYSNMKSKKFITDILYNYFLLNESSATNRYKPNMSIVLNNQAEAILKWVDEYNYAKYLPYHAYLRIDDIILLIKFDFYNKKNNEKNSEKKKRLKKLLNEYGYKNYYKLAKKENLLSLCKKSKRLVIWLSLHNCFFLLSIITKIKYRK